MDDCRKQEKLFLTPTIICTLVLMYTKAKIQVWCNFHDGFISSCKLTDHVSFFTWTDFQLSVWPGFCQYFKTSWSLPYFILINSTQLYCSNLYITCHDLKIWFENAFRVKDHKIPFLNWINLQCKIVAGRISKTWTGSILPKSFFLSSYGFCVVDHPA